MSCDVRQTADTNCSTGSQGFMNTEPITWCTVVFTGIIVPWGVLAFGVYLEWQKYSKNILGIQIVTNV